MTDENQQEDKNPLDSRLKDLLSDKAKLSQDVAAKDLSLQEAQAKLANLERENNFNSGFADVLGTHPMAKDHKEEIKAKVLSGYTPEDAAFAVLGKAGKLGGNPIAPPSPAGGSATNTITSTGQKTAQEMTQTERRDALAKEMLWT